MLGSNQRRLSRRYYSPSLLAEVHATDQHIHRLRRFPGPPPSAMRPWAPGLVHGRGAENPTDGGGGSGYADRPAGFWLDLAFQGSHSLSSFPSWPVSDSAAHRTGTRTLHSIPRSSPASRRGGPSSMRYLGNTGSEGQLGT